jgi:hypothetical protein
MKKAHGNIHPVAYAVTKKFGSIFRLTIMQAGTLIRCIDNASLLHPGGSLYSKDSYRLNHIDDCLGLGSPYGLIVYQKSRPYPKSAGETNSIGHYLQTGEIVGLFEEEEQAKWFSLGIKWGFFLDNNLCESSAYGLTVSVLREWIKFKDDFVPDKEMVKKYKLK